MSLELFLVGFILCYCTIAHMPAPSTPQCTEKISCNTRRERTRVVYSIPVVCFRENDACPMQWRRGTKKIPERGCRWFVEVSGNAFQVPIPSTSHTIIPALIPVARFPLRLLSVFFFAGQERTVARYSIPESVCLPDDLSSLISNPSTAVQSKNRHRF